MIDRLKDSINDFRLSLNDRNFWSKYALADVSRIYARTRFGIVWELFGPLVFVFGIGFAYSRLHGYPLAVYFPHLALGYIIWLNMQMHVGGSCSLFLKYKSVVLGAKRPLLSFILRHYVAAMIYSAVHLLILLPIILFNYDQFKNFHITWFFIYFSLYNICAIALSIIISIVSLRIRDVPHFLLAVNRLAFFVTPVIWMEKNLGEIGEIVLKLNPYSYFLVGQRNAILGQDGSYFDLGVVCIITTTLLICSLMVLSWAKPRLTRWL